jgi:hypothetical protein
MELPMTDHKLIDTIRAAVELLRLIEQSGLAVVANDPATTIRLVLIASEFLTGAQR